MTIIFDHVAGGASIVGNIALSDGEVDWILDASEPLAPAVTSLKMSTGQVSLHRFRVPGGWWSIRRAGRNWSAKFVRSSS